MPRIETTRIGSLALLLVAGTVVGLVEDHSASAEQSKRTPRRAAPASQAHSAPDVTGSIKSQKPTPAPAVPVVKNDDDAPLKPFDLPAAPRARMRQCGESWQKIKLAGDAGDRTWRDFATACLAERTAAAPSGPAQNAGTPASR